MEQRSNIIMDYTAIKKGSYIIFIYPHTSDQILNVTAQFKKVTAYTITFTKNYPL